MPGILVLVSSRDLHTVAASLLELSPFPSVTAYVSRGHALIGALIDAREGNVVFSARIAARGDALAGFRPVHAFTIGSRETATPSTTSAAIADDAALLADPMMRTKVVGAGRHRVVRERATDQRSSLFEQMWRERRLLDRVQLVHALDADRELWLSFDRLAGEQPFTAAERRTLATVAATIGGWARRVAYLLGYAPDVSPLSERERATLAFLLSDHPQKLLARHLAVSEARARELVRTLYVKLAVAGRLELIWRWIGRPPQAAAPPVLATSRRARSRQAAPRR
jgi:DNA-binding CsgD family transcriptional regulator